MDSPLRVVIVFILFFMFSLVNSINPITAVLQPNHSNQFISSHLERNGVIGRFQRFLASINSTYSLKLIDPVWAQDSEQQPTSSGAQLPKDYVIGLGDVLEVFVWRNEQLSREVVVRPDGGISLPLIQDIHAEGMTVLELKNEITHRFGEHLNHPRVSVIVKQINSYKVSVLGRVTQPGVYPITGNTRLVEAISMAGGFTEWANKRKIRVITYEDGKEKEIIINYLKIAKGKDRSQNILLKRGDTIIVP
jgi:polysaccharide export outer membrane protein